MRAICKKLQDVRRGVGAGAIPGALPNWRLLRDGGLRLAPGPVAEEVVEVLLELGQVDDLGRGGGAAADRRPDQHLVAGLDRADAAALGIHGGRTVHDVSVGVPVRAAQRDGRARDRGYLAVLEGDGLVTTAGLGRDVLAVDGAERPGEAQRPGEAR